MTCADRRLSWAAWTPWIRVGALVLALAGAAAAQQREHEGARSARRERQAAEHQRHWRDRPEAERRVLEERLQRFQDLSPARREELLARARVLREQEREWRRSMPRPLREELDRLPPAARRERWHQHVRERMRQRGQDLRERMPPEVRERLEKAPAPLRRRLAEHLEQGRRRCLEEMGLSPEEHRAWERLPYEQRVRRVRERVRERRERREGHPRQR
jgi:hypothetical protein